MYKLKKINEKFLPYSLRKLVMIDCGLENFELSFEKIYVSFWETQRNWPKNSTKSIFSKQNFFVFAKNQRKIAKCYLKSYKYDMSVRSLWMNVCHWWLSVT